MSKLKRRIFYTLTILALAFCVGSGYFLFIRAENQNGERTTPTTDIGTIYVSRGNILEPFFREPFESSMMIYGDLSVVMWSTHDEHGIGGTAGERAEYLKSIGHPIDTVMMIVHNHTIPGGFSLPDKEFYRQLRNLGFQGIYGIYQTFNKEVIWLPESFQRDN